MARNASPDFRIRQGTTQFRRSAWPWSVSRDTPGTERSTCLVRHTDGPHRRRSVMSATHRLVIRQQHRQRAASSVRRTSRKEPACISETACSTPPRLYKRDPRQHRNPLALHHVALTLPRRTYLLLSERFQVRSATRLGHWTGIGGVGRQGKRFGEHAERCGQLWVAQGRLLSTVGDGVEFMLAEDAEVVVFGQVLPEQPVGVFAGTALPGAVGVAEVDLHAGAGCQLGVAHHLLALVVGEALAQRGCNRIQL